jgi:hypothetical protein
VGKGNLYHVVGKSPQRGKPTFARATTNTTRINMSTGKKEDWMNSKWRPCMGWLYMAVCAFDFILAPILWSVLQAISAGSVNTQWQPLTLQGAGLFHLAMGAVLGIAAYGRTQEKLGGAAGFGAGAGTTYVPPGQQNTVNIGAPAADEPMPNRAALDE